MTRILLAGTPEFAARVFQPLVEQRRDEVIAVITQPDRPAGRGRRLRPPPVKELAQAHGLPVLQPA
ncbi:MAG: methionyl-tRNA formyltransferase, partial [Gammaproteobacteria bacterium]